LGVILIFTFNQFKNKLYAFRKGYLLPNVIIDQKIKYLFCPEYF